MSPLERITKRVNQNGDVNLPETPRPLLTLTEFFDGNKTVGSIGCNLTPTPTPSELYEILTRIAYRTDVHDIRVQISMFDDPDWPFSDTVWIITSAESDDVSKWFDEPVRPDECWSGWTDGVSFEPYEVPPEFNPVACWWD